MEWQCRDYCFNLKHRPLVMGIVNITENSFSDGGCFFTSSVQLDVDKIVSVVTGMIEEGVDIIDVGAESTKPGASQISPEIQLSRLLPVVQALKSLNIPLSIDTSSPEVIQALYTEGVAILNDVTALRDASDDFMDWLKDSGLGVCLMHMQGTPQTMQNEPTYQNVIKEVSDFLIDRYQFCLSYGIASNRIMLDPGIGFGKTIEHNTILLKNLSTIVEQVKAPLLLGVSRKSILEAITGRLVHERLAGSLALVAWLFTQQVSVFRVHDVPETIDVLKVLNYFSEKRV